MSNGPLNSYIAPSVITRTELKGNVTAPPTGARIPVFIGTGKETLTLTDHEMVRGSSASVDLRINNEDVSSNFIKNDGNTQGATDGTATRFKVKHVPIVSGAGQGRVTNNPQHVSVTVNGVDVVVAAVRGEEGIVTLQVPPQEGSKVEVTYHFRRTDTLRVDDVSDQVDPEEAILTASGEGPYDIDATQTELSLEVDGTHLDITLTPGQGVTASALAGEINAQKGATQLEASVTTDFEGKEFLTLTGRAVLRIGDGSANSVLGFYEGQRTRRTRTFFTHQGPIVVGDGGGRTTGDPADITVRVNGAVVAVQTVDGSDRAVTLEQPPPVGAQVEIEYYYNTWQDTQDYLPHIDIRQILSVGFAPGRNDYVEGLDFVIDRDTGEIHWGTSWTVGTGRFTSVQGDVPFGKDQLDVRLRDDRVYMEEAEIISGREVRILRVPVTGEDRGIETTDPAHLDVYVGRTVEQADANGSRKPVKVDPQTRVVTLREPIKPGQRVFVTYHYNRLGDNEYTVEKVGPGAVRITTPALQGGAPLFNVRFGSNGTSSTNVPVKDPMIVGARGIAEEVTFTYNNAIEPASPAVFVFPQKGPFHFVAGHSDELIITIDGGTSQTFTLTDGSGDPLELEDIETALSALAPEASASINSEGLLEITTAQVGKTASIKIEGTALLQGTGLGLDPDGTEVEGNDAVQGFIVSSDQPNGSGSGQNDICLVGQTYVDEVTGLTCTIMEGDAPYADTEFFTLIVEDTHVTDVLNMSVPGVTLQTKGNFGDVVVGDTAVLTTYNKSGQEPGIGEYYYISYEYGKTDYGTKLFTRFDDIERHFGELGPDNPLTLASYLAMQNGASIVALKQVQRSPGLLTAPANSYIRALEELKKPLEGGVRPNLIVPLTTDPSVVSATTLHCETQSSPRNRNECRAIFGVASGTRPVDASALARGLNSDRAMLVYPDTALITLTDPLGNDATYVVDGTALASALAGVTVNPSDDVATPLTRKTLVGFERLNRTLEDVEKDMLATSGVTVLQDRAPLIEVRHALTTNLDNRLTSTPSVVDIRDYVQQQSRKILERFVGLKFLSSRAQDVELALTGLLRNLVESQIIADYTGVSAEPDPSDPTIMRVSAYYSPIFPLLYIDVHFVITANSV